ncbi:MAG: zinc ABC transporter substrate-binding protein [Alphaproteobacteria bacterium]|nr:zinc ABC transporter substrate-binding protein [Alphaproteobacteria bacterium]
MPFRLTIALALWLMTAAPVTAAVNVFACEPEWAALAERIGGDLVSIYAATTAKQDPHQVQARPSLIARARAADLVICTGAELEVGWMPLVLRQAANPRIRPGGPGYLEAATLVSLVEVPSVLDRSQGDVHADGNPHIQTDPRNLLPVAQELSRRLGQIDAANAAAYRARQAAFAAEFEQAIARWQQTAAPLRYVPVVVAHKNWSYLINWLGLREVATLEPKPGVPPSGGHLSDVLARVRSDPVRMIIHAAYESPRAAQWLAERARVPAVELPFTVGGTEDARDLIGLFDATIARLLRAASNPSG